MCPEAAIKFASLGVQLSDTKAWPIYVWKYYEACPGESVRYNLKVVAIYLLII